VHATKSCAAVSVNVVAKISPRMNKSPRAIVAQSAVNPQRHASSQRRKCAVASVGVLSLRIPKFHA
jgi:hypothetical protein